ncbi:MAG: Gfo/Idh/MocA family oxidoreductase [Armatimonadota bacterium]|nr:Gfo/Idh/MocA family oxidoreductase [Armatimonadota bacterium]
MDVLILGCSRIAQKRVIPALASLPEVGRIHFASRAPLDGSPVPAEKRGEVLTGYEAALAALQPCLVYVSLPNSLHAEWVEKALQRGFHVVVDKPAVLSLQNAEALAELARRSRLCLAEATVWSYHPQVEIAKRLFTDAGSAPTRLAAVFSFPPLNPSDWRYRAALGGGSLFDQGPYAVSCGRVFFGVAPTEVVCRVHSRDEEVETSFSVLATYPNGCAMTGHFGFNTEYRNSILLLGPGVAVELDRVFTMPPDLPTEVSVRQNNTNRVVSVPAADTFARFFAEVFRAIEAGDTAALTDALLQDAACLHRLRQSAGVI